MRVPGVQDGPQVHSGEAGLTFPPSNTATCCFRLQFGAHRLRGLEQALQRPHAPLQGVHPLEFKAMTHPENLFAKYTVSDAKPIDAKYGA